MSGIFQNNRRKRVRDSQTGKEYPTLAAAGRELAYLVQGDPKNNLVWYEIERRFPGRFEVYENGQWVRRG
jgi:hypothetical protein